MNKYEQEWTTPFQKWLKWKDFDARIEVKVVKPYEANYCYNSDKSFKGEMRRLLAKRTVYKCSDAGGRGNPFDVFSSSDPPYFVIHWIRPRNKKFYMIKAKDLNDFIINEKPKSISEEMCKHLGTTCTLR